MSYHNLYMHYLDLYQKRYLPSQNDITWMHISFWRRYAILFSNILIYQNLMTMEQRKQDMAFVATEHNGMEINIRQVQEAIKLKPEYIL